MTDLKEGFSDFVTAGYLMGAIIAGALWPVWLVIVLWVTL